MSRRTPSPIRTRGQLEKTQTQIFQKTLGRTLSRTRVSKSMKQIKREPTLNKNCRYSQSGIFALSPNDVDYFYIRREEVGRLSSYNQYNEDIFDINMNIAYKNPSLYSNDYYFRVTPKRHIEINEPDCLIFAEGMCLNDPTYKKSASQFRVRDANDKRLFGVSDKQNKELLEAVADNVKNKYHINKYADPEEGQAFAIVRQELSKDEALAPYHIAFVLLKDGRDCVTIEVDAGDPERIRPIFDIYRIASRNRSSSDSTLSSFHDRFKDYYTIGGIEPITIVLQYKKSK